jgi:hypothetical protein
MKSDRLLNALTQQEVAQLIDALLAVLSPELQEEAVAQLAEDTQQTIRQILASDSAIEHNRASDTQTISLAKQAQTWSELWQGWDEIIGEASEESGEYVIQEVDWEPPYFDTNRFAEDLDSIAAQMQPLLQTAFEHEFRPDRGFASALLAAELEISSGLEDWMEMTEGIYLGRSLTECLLQWEWLTVQKQEQNAFQLAQRIREHELQFQQIELRRDTVLDFFTQLSEAEQRCLLTGFMENRESSSGSEHWAIPIPTGMRSICI